MPDVRQFNYRSGLTRKMKVLLINPPYLPNYSRPSRSPAVAKSGTLYYPLFLSYCGAYLTSKNIECKLIDAIGNNLNYDEIIGIISGYSPDYIICESSIPSGKKDALFLDSLKKKFADKFCILAGTYPTSYNSEIADAGYCFDAYIRGEYETSILDLILNHGKSNLSSIYCNNGNNFINGSVCPEIIDLDVIPFVSEFYKTNLNIKKYRYSASRHPVVTILSSRGCPYKCGFCNLPNTFYAKPYRQRGVENFLEEFEYIKNQMSEVKEVFIEDDSFNISLDFIKKFCMKKIEAGNQLPWSANFSPHNFDEETLRLMKKAGCRLVVIGYETGNEEMIKSIKKISGIKKYTELTDLLNKYGIMIHGCFIIGLPGETRQTVEKTISFASSIKLDSAQFFPLMLNNGVPMYEEYLENNNITARRSDYNTEDGLHRTNIKTQNLSSEEIMHFCQIARRRYYLDFSYIFRKFKYCLYSYEELSRNIRGFFKILRHL